MQRVRLVRDQVIAALLLPGILCVLAGLYPIVILLQGRPFLHRSERMRDADTAFFLLKIRTMRPAEQADDEPLGGHNTARVTAIGAVLRRTRLDELPQILNVLTGDIGFVGPRPPLRKHVAACPRRYRRVLTATRPGITGLATVLVHKREERLLSRCQTFRETEDVYLTHCLPMKLRIEAIYLRNRSLWLDLRIIWRTFAGLRLSRPVAVSPPVPVSETPVQPKSLARAA
jgi:lipopolysaccharide/colanic/teichoic acid biosynthesis glycosyltransferase